MKRSLLNRCVVFAAFVFSVIAVFTVAVMPAKAVVYNDTQFEENGGGDNSDIANVQITDDGTNITFKLTTNPFANLQTNYFNNYDYGIQIGNGAGGQTLINSAFALGNPATGNPYGDTVGISTGENFFIGNYLGFVGNPIPIGAYPGGAELFSFSTVGGWSKIGGTHAITEVYTGTPSSSFTIPLADLGLSPGSSFKFDVWTSFGGGPNGAYDALGNPAKTPDFPYTSGGNPPYNYDSASTLLTYTVSVPEPTSATLVVLGGISLLALARGRRTAR